MLDITKPCAKAPENEQSIRHLLPSFDEMAYLARTDPEAFESLRAHICEQAIARSPAHMQQRLKGLQFIIDQERKRSRSNLSACLKISNMMNESLLKLNAAFSNPKEYLQNYYSKSADIIALHIGRSE